MIETSIPIPSCEPLPLRKDRREVRNFVAMHANLRLFTAWHGHTELPAIPHKQLPPASPLFFIPPVLPTDHNTTPPPPTAVFHVQPVAPGGVQPGRRFGEGLCVAGAGARARGGGGVA